MDIKTKYSIDDVVWYIYANKVHKSKIKSIKFCTDDNIVEYVLNDYDTENFYENNLFVSKEELLKTL